MAAALQQNMKLGISLRLLSQKTRETGSTDPSQKHVDSEKLPSFPKKTTATMLCIGFLVYLFFFPNHNHSPICEPDQDPPLATISSINTLAIAENISRIPSEDLKKMSYPENPVKIYLYELPERFTYGVIEHFSLARGHGSSGSTYPSHQHKAEWHLFKDLTRPDEERVGSPVVRVLDPDKADLFYVPFFSSLSSVVNQGGGGGPRGGPRYSDEETQVALVEWLEAREHWKRNRGRDHVIVATDPNAYHKVMDRIKRSVLLVSDFGRLRTDQASLVKDVIVPYFHRIHSYNGDIGVANRNTLLFFMGARYRKEGGKIRNVLFQILENEEDVVIKSGTQSMANRRAASHGMHTSKFCLNPAGDTPSACRLFDSIVSLCVPVIVSDDIELPFEDVIDYTKLAIFVETSMALKPGFLVTMLRAIPAERILQYQKELQEVKNYFEYGNTTVNEIWRQVAQKQPMIKFMINRDKRLQQANLNKPDRSFLF